MIMRAGRRREAPTTLKRRYWRSGWPVTFMGIRHTACETTTCHYCTLTHMPLPTPPIAHAWLGGMDLAHLLGTQKKRRRRGTLSRPNWLRAPLGRVPGADDIGRQSVNGAPHGRKQQAAWTAQMDENGACCAHISSRHKQNLNDTHEPWKAGVASLEEGRSCRHEQRLGKSERKKETFSLAYLWTVLAQDRCSA